METGISSIWISHLPQVQTYFQYPSSWYIMKVHFVSFHFFYLTDCRIKLPSLWLDSSSHSNIVDYQCNGLIFDNGNRIETHEWVDCNIEPSSTARRDKILVKLIVSFGTFKCNLVGEGRHFSVIFIMVKAHVKFETDFQKWCRASCYFALTLHFLNS